MALRCPSCEVPLRYIVGITDYSEDLYTLRSIEDAEERLQFDTHTRERLSPREARRRNLEGSVPCPSCGAHCVPTIADESALHSVWSGPDKDSDFLRQDPTP